MASCAAIKEKEEAKRLYSAGYARNAVTVQPGQDPSPDPNFGQVLICPITSTVFRDPVHLFAARATYEREALLAYWKFKGHQCRHPETNQLLMRPDITTDHCMRGMVQKFLDANQDYKPKGWDSRKMLSATNETSQIEIPPDMTDLKKEYGEENLSKILGSCNGSGGYMDEATIEERAKDLIVNKYWCLPATEEARQEKEEYAERLRKHFGKSGIVYGDYGKDYGIIGNNWKVELVQGITEEEIQAFDKQEQREILEEMTEEELQAFSKEDRRRLHLVLPQAIQDGGGGCVYGQNIPPCAEAE